MNENDKKMNICLCFDDNIAMFATVLMASVCLNHTDVKVKFYILHYKLSKKNVDACKATAEKFGAEFEELVITEEEMAICGKIKKLQNFGYLPESSFFRLFIPEKVFTDRVLYLDVDIIVNGNIYEFYNCDMGKYEIAAVNSTVIAAKPDIRKNVMNHKMDAKIEDLMLTAQIFGSGILLFNLVEFKDYDWLAETKNLMSYIKEKGRKNFAFGDQGLLNFIFVRNNKLKLFFDGDLRWGARTGNIKRDFSDIDEIKLIHYWGAGSKPWDFLYDSHFEKIFAETNQSRIHSPLFFAPWWKYVKYSPFSEEIKTRASLKIQRFYLDFFESFYIQSNFEKISKYNAELLEKIRFVLDISVGHSVYDSECYIETATDEYLEYKRTADTSKDKCWVKFPLPAVLEDEKKYKLECCVKYYSKDYFTTDSKNCLQFLLGDSATNYVRSDKRPVIDKEQVGNIVKVNCEFTIPKTDKRFNYIFFSNSCLQNPDDFLQIYSMKLTEI